MATGANVTKFTVGEYAAVGFMADSCMDCTNCRRGEEHLCSNGEVISIFNSRYMYPSHACACDANRPIWLFRFLSRFA